MPSGERRSEGGSRRKKACQRFGDELPLLPLTKVDACNATSRLVPTSPPCPLCLACRLLMALVGDAVCGLSTHSKPPIVIIPMLAGSHLAQHDAHPLPNHTHYTAHGPTTLVAAWGGGGQPGLAEKCGVPSGGVVGK